MLLLHEKVHGIVRKNKPHGNRPIVWRVLKNWVWVGLYIRNNDALENQTGFHILSCTGLQDCVLESCACWRRFVPFWTQTNVHIKMRWANIESTWDCSRVPATQQFRLQHGDALPVDLFCPPMRPRAFLPRVHFSIYHAFSNYSRGYPDLVEDFFLE